MFQTTVFIALFGFALAGVIKPDHGGRIVGGEATTIEKYPYQVSLQRRGMHFCGGSLYSADVVVTAAHCLQSYPANQIKIRLGSSEYASGGELIQVKAFKFHEAYDSNKMINDIAVIKLETPVKFSDKIQPIELADSVPADGTPAVVSGWGTDKFFTGSIQEQLQVVEVNIVPLSKCKSDAYKYGAKILETMVCAAVENGGKDACQGDSGGPLASGGKLVGVVSWGIMCARKEYPGVYASVPELRSWIVKNAAEI